MSKAGLLTASQWQSSEIEFVLHFQKLDYSESERKQKFN